MPALNLFYAGPAGLFAYLLQSRQIILNPIIKQEKLSPFVGKKLEKERNECSSSREGGVCDWRSWVHSIAAGEALAPPWVHC